MPKPRKKFEDSSKFNAKPLIIAGLVVLLILGIYLAAKPLRRSMSRKFINEGDRHLAEAKYIEALVDFRKSEFLVPGSASKDIDDCHKMQTDITAGEMYFRKYDNIAMMNALKDAGEIPESESEGLEKVKKIIEDNQPQVAEVAAGILIEMDDKSAKAWAYLGIARLQSARLTEMSEGIRNNKLVAAREAFSQAIALDPTDEISKKYLREVDKLL